MGEKLLAINSTPAETRIALVDQDQLCELVIEREQAQGIVGNVYKGKVTRVLPGMQAAFVEVGLDRTTFLYGGDVYDAQNLEQKRRESIAEHSDQAETEKTTPVLRTPIEKLIKEGEQIVVQVTKEPLGSKGARITTFISLPGRFLVLMPEFDHIGISRRLDDPELRLSLHEIAERIKPKGFGLIMRTAAENAGEDALQREVDFLKQQWEKIQSLRKSASAPQLIHKEPDFIQRVVRDWITSDVAKILIDSKSKFNELQAFLNDHMPNDAKKLELHSEATPLFDHLDIELDIGKASGRKVWLPSGGYLVIDHTEALTSFDINTGRFVGKVSAKETILKTNLEAATEIPRQLKLRNIGGIIVIDFIDMVDLEDRVKVEEALIKALESDKAKNQVLKISEFGLVQMTRKRTSESLERQLMIECPSCSGRGVTPSISTHLSEMSREIERYCVRTKEKVVHVKLRKDLKESFQKECRNLLKWLVKKHKVKIKLQDLDDGYDAIQNPPYEVGP